MEEIYEKLNFYLNEVCLYLEKSEPLLLKNIAYLSNLNDNYLNLLNKYELDSQSVQNHLTYYDVFNITRKIISTIDPNYLQYYDTLIDKGFLEFNYEKDNRSAFTTPFSYFETGKIAYVTIDVNREFNYNDVFILLHEFIHYINLINTNINFQIRNDLTEFLAIYFEIYAIDYLINKGINNNEIETLSRIEILKRNCNKFYNYENTLLSFQKFGPLSNYSITLLQKYYKNIKTEDIQNEYKTIYENFTSTINKNKEKLKKDPSTLGKCLSRKHFSHNYKYIMATILALYARKYCKFQDVIKLNNNLNKYENENFSQIFQSIGINLNDKDFLTNGLTATEEYITNYTKNRRL